MIAGASPSSTVGCRLLLLAALLGLASCASPPRREAAGAALVAQQARESVLAQQTDWALSGRIAVSDGRDGGSGSIDWRQQGDRFTIQIRAPVSRQTWRLSGSGAGATLEGLEGGPRSGPDAEALLREAVGWTVPIADLKAWARGARADGVSEVDFDAQQRPAAIRQRGWNIQYRAWDASQLPMPRKVFAGSGDRRVRLIVERWDVGSGGA